MEEIIKWIIENKEIAIVACITIGISISVRINFGKTIINNIKITDQNKHKNEKNKRPSHEKYKNNKKKSTKFITDKSVTLTNIRLYSTGKKGKVYTTTFYKAMNHNFGIEITLKNNTSSLQNVKVGWCIYKDGKEIIKGTFYKKVNANSSLSNDFYVQQKTFNNLKNGKYKSQFWVNDRKVQKKHFTITNK